ncbi:hypothetical protein MMC18_002526 [Xylographa bjoerkii]|nr:hypothetical protein [Xylographa bjoerkii]
MRTANYGTLNPSSSNRMPPRVIIIPVPAPKAASLDMMPMKHHRAVDHRTDHEDPAPPNHQHPFTSHRYSYASKESLPGNDHGHNDQDTVVAHHYAIDAHAKQHRPQQHVGELEGEVDLRGQALAGVEDDFGDEEGDGDDGEGDDEGVEATMAGLARYGGLGSGDGVGCEGGKKTWEARGQAGDEEAWPRTYASRIAGVARVREHS